jgi:phage gp29-like protein
MSQEIRPTTDIPREPPASVLRPNFSSDKAPSAEVKGMPFNYGEGLLPHVVTFQGIISSVSRVYRYYDEAMKASLENARFMRNDLMIMEPVEQRRRACALLNWHLEVDDQDNPTEKKLAEDLTKILKQIPNFLKFRENLLDAVWFGKYAVQFAWKWKRLRGVTAVNGLGQNMVIDHWKPLHGDKVVFRYDDGTREYDPNQVGIRVGAGYTAGDKGIQGRMSASGRRKVEPTDYGLAYFLEPWERRLLAIHKHMIEDGEYEDPQSAGKIHGVGIRSRIYWTWYMKQECFAHLLEFLERSATGVEIWYYPWGNPEAEAKVRKAAEDRIGNARNVILMPRPVGEDAQAFGVEIVQQNIAGIEALKVLVEEYFGNAIMRYVLGQTMTNKPQAGGFGSELPTVQLGTYLQIIKYDSLNLGETMTTDVVDVLKANNYPHLLDIPCRFVVDTESEDAAGKLAAWKQAYDCGVKTKAGDWLKMIGASKPEEDDEVIQNPVTMQQDRLYQQFMEHKNQAAAMGMTPEGTPQPGEAPQQEQGGLGEEMPPEMGAEPGMEPEGPQQFSARFDPEKHPRGKPKNKGQFAEKEGHSQEGSDEQGKYPNVNWEEMAKLPLTNNPKKAGYIRPDGGLIDLSYGEDARGEDHRIAGGTAGMQEFSAAGNIRWMPENDGLDITAEPTAKQYKVIFNLAARCAGEMVVELEAGLGEWDEGNGYYRNNEKRFYQEYERGTSPKKIVADIQAFYGGNTPYQSPFKEFYAMSAHDSPQGGPYMDGQPDPEELAKGIEEEMREHGMSREEARKTALDHLRESPRYYSIIEKALAEAKSPQAEKYLMTDGSRMADAGIAEGRNEKDWTIPATKHTYAAGGPEGGTASHDAGAQGSASPSGSVDYAKKSAPGQKGMFDEEKHPRGKPDNAGQFTEKGDTGTPKKEASRGHSYRFHRGSIENTLEAATKAARDANEPRYVVPTANGYTIGKEPGPGTSIKVESDGTATRLGRELPPEDENDELHQLAAKAKADRERGMPKQEPSAPGQKDIFGGVEPKREPKAEMGTNVPKPPVQTALLHGLKDAPGQQDLFNADKGADEKPKQPTATTQPIKVERRGAPDRRGGSLKAGIFFAKEGESTAEYGEDTHAATIKSGTRIYSGKSSFDLIEDRGLLDSAVDEVIQKQTGKHTLREVREAMDEGDIEGNNDLYYDAFQIVARQILEKEGYQGAHWTEEEDLTPEQYQVWDRAALQPAQPEGSGETAKERAARTFKETQEKFADEAASTETISEREARRKAEKLQRHAASFTDQLLARYYKASDAEAQERFWQGDEREIIVIQEGHPMRYSRRHGAVSCEYIKEET